MCRRNYGREGEQGDVALRSLVPGYRPKLATRGDHARAVAAAMVTLAAELNKAA